MHDRPVSPTTGTRDTRNGADELRLYCDDRHVLQVIFAINSTHCCCSDHDPPRQMNRRRAVADFRRQARMSRKTQEKERVVDRTTYCGENCGDSKHFRHHD